jgi:hypothetical protein
MPTQQSHTLPSRTSRHTSQNLAKSVPAPPEKKFNFFLPSLRCFNFFATHNRHKNKWTDTAKTHTGQGLTMTEDRRPAYNTGFASGGVTWLNQVLCINQPLCYVDSFVLRNPPERKARKRCAQP